jgi:hypothetical protein
VLPDLLCSDDRRICANLEVQRGSPVVNRIELSEFPATRSVKRFGRMVFPRAAESPKK